MKRVESIADIQAALDQLPESVRRRIDAPVSPGPSYHDRCTLCMAYHSSQGEGPYLEAFNRAIKGDRVLLCRRHNTFVKAIASELVDKS